MNTIVTDSPLSEGDTRALAMLAGMMIPASESHNVPAADDDLILSDILGTARQHAELLEAGLAGLEARAQEAGGTFTELDADQRQSLAQQTQASDPSFYRVLVSITVQCYYRDARVMESLGMEARPPFPKGFEVPEGDWSLLDPVRDRGRIWREA